MDTHTHTHSHTHTHTHTHTPTHTPPHTHTHTHTHGIAPHRDPSLAEGPREQHVSADSLAPQMLREMLIWGCLSFLEGPRAEAQAQTQIEAWFSFKSKQDKEGIVPVATDRSMRQISESHCIDVARWISLSVLRTLLTRLRSAAMNSAPSAPLSRRC